MRSLGGAAQGEAAELADIDPDSAEYETETPEGDSHEFEYSIEHGFQLRPDLRISIKLPQDFTAKEGERLAGFMRQLPFADEFSGGLSNGPKNREDLGKDMGSKYPAFALS